MPGQNIIGICKGPVAVLGLINSVYFSVITPASSIDNFSTSDCDACKTCCAGSNSYTETYPTSLDKTYTRDKSGPYFELTKACCSTCDFGLVFHDKSSGSVDSDGNPVDSPGLTFKGHVTDNYAYGDGDATNPDGSYKCNGQQPSSGSLDGPEGAFTGIVNLSFYADNSGNCVFDLNVTFDDGIGGGSVTAIPLADLLGTHTITFSVTITNPGSVCGTDPATYSYEETYTVTIS